MTQPPPPLPPDPDDLASAIVDGLLSRELAEVARRDPAVVRRVDDILRVRAALRAPTPAPQGSADRAMAAALAAFDQASPASDPGPQHLRVVARPSGATPASPRHRRRLPAPWLAAAAAILVVVGVLVVGLVGQPDDDAATEESAEVSTDSDAGAEQSEESGADAPEAEAGEAESSDGTTTAFLPPPHLGSVTGVDQLQAQVRANLADGQAAADRSAASPQADTPADALDDEAGCPGLSLVGDPARGTATFVADADFEGRGVRIHVYELADELRLVATDASCADVVDVPYPG